MQTYYEKIREEQGEEAANEYMRSLRAKVKTPGLMGVDKERRSSIVKKGWKTRKKV